MKTRLTLAALMMLAAGVCLLSEYKMGVFSNNTAAQILPSGCSATTQWTDFCGEDGPKGCGIGTIRFSLPNGQFGVQGLQTQNIQCEGTTCPSVQMSAATFNGACCDQDGDGYQGAGCGGSDCNDNPQAGGFNVNPGRPEVCGDGIDNDCQGGDAACPTPTPTPTPQVCHPCTYEPGYSEFSSEWCGEGFHWSCTGCRCVRNSPVLVDVRGDGFAMTDAAHGVNFDFHGDGPERTSWTAMGADDAFLVLDRNGNGTIDNGAELFGNVTPQPEPPPGEERQGFLALAEYDKAANGGNGDGKISRLDTIFSSLRLWQDANHNAVSEAGELRTLQQLGLKSIDLDYRTSRRRDEHGNEFKYRAKVKDKNDAQLGRWAWDVFLVSAR